MALSTSRKAVRPPAASAHFVDADERARLQEALADLQSPAEPTWRLVKRNSSRSVFRGQLAGRGLYLKQFHPRSALRRMLRRLGLSDARREFDLSRLLRERGVRATPVLAAAWSGDAEWVISEEVAPAQPGDQWHRRQLQRGREGRDAVRQASRRMARLLAKLHAAGVVHRDLHCGNVLVRTDTRRPEPILMDLHSARRRWALSRRARAVNLAQLCCDRTPWTSRSERLRFLRDYLRFSGAGGTLRGWAWLITFFARRHARRLEAHRDRRISGRNRYFTHFSPAPGWRARVILASKRHPSGSRASALEFRGEQWADALARPEALAAREGAEVIKDSPSCLVVRRALRVGDHELDVHIKRPLKHKPAKAFLDRLRGSRAMRAFRSGHMLLTRRVETALPLAALERRSGLRVTDCLLITETAPGLPLERYLSEADPAAVAGRHRLLRRLGRLIRTLHDLRFTHRDLKAGNILVHADKPDDPHPLLVDLDGLSRPRFVTAYRRYRDFARLNVALLRCESVSAAGRLRALLGYLSDPGAGRVRFKVPWRVVDELTAKILARQERSRQRRKSRNAGGTR